MKVTKVDFQFGHCGCAFVYLPIMLISLCTPAASAQCSQATQPAVASSANSIALTPHNAQESTSDGFSSSSVETGPLRFTTGTAVTVLENTSLQVMNDMPISSRTTKVGAMLSFTLTRDVVVGDTLVIPCGATVLGTVVSAKQAGRLTGASNLTLELTALNLNGKSYRLYTIPFKVFALSKTRPTVHKIATGAAVGAVAAQATVPTMSYTIVPGQRVYYKPSPADQAKYDAVMAGLGAGVGVAIAASSAPSIARIPAESQMEFTLASPIAVYPVNQRTARRLARGMYRGGPVLYVRGESQ